MKPRVLQLPAPPAPHRPRSRRERRCEAARRPVTHVIMPGMEVARAEIRPRETITAFLRRTGWAVKDKLYGWQFRKGLPTVLEINGASVLRRDWRTRRVAAGDNVRFVSYPLGGARGGGAKQILGLVALIAVAAFAFWAGPALFGAGTFGAFLTTAAIGIGGSLLVNALTAPKAGATNAPTATQDQIYSVQAQGNTAKLGQPLPVWYGRLKVFPDFAATPWGEFVANDQYLNVLLSVGMGSFSYEALYVSDTILWDPVNGVSATFTGAQVAFYEPGATVTLFPTNVDSSIEVTGQQLPDGSGTNGGQYVSATATTAGANVGGFVANPSGTLAQAIAVDFVFPSGCFTVNTSNNNIGFAYVTLIAEYAPCDDAGAQTSAYVNLFQVTRQYASTSPVRDSVKVNVTPGRYLVRFRRGDAGLTTTQGSNAVIWAGLRSFLQGANSFADVATVAIRLLATQSTQGSYKFGVLATRKLPVWNGSAFVTQATRNPAWAFYDAVVNAQYGSGLAISKVDFNSVVSVAAGADSRGDHFDYVFSSAVAIPAAFDKILTVTRSRHFWLGDTVSLVRDEWRDVPTMMLTDREIVRDSTQVGWTMLGDEDPDAVIVEYIDQNTWLPAQVQYPPDSQFFTATHAEVKRIDGIVDRSQAFRECAFYYLQSIYRRETVQLGTEYEGRAITFGSVIRVQSELPMAYGYAGSVIGVFGTALELNPAPVWDAGPFYIRLRQPNGKYFGPVLVTQGASATIANLDASSLASAQAAQSTTLTAVLAREAGGEDPSFEFGTANSESKLCVVLNGVPNGELCTLNLVVDDQRVHATDLGDPPILPIGQFPVNANLPLIVGLNGSFGQGTAEPLLSASWFPAAGAIYYIADASYDGGNSWQQVYQGQANQFTAIVTLAALTLRVQAVTPALHGPYASIGLSAPTIVIASATVALESLIAGIKYQVTTVLDQLDSVKSQAEQYIASLSSNDIAVRWLDKQESKTELTSQIGQANASITQVQTVANSTSAALASFTTSVTAQFGTVNSSITTEQVARSTADSALAASISTVSTTVGGHTATLQLLASSVNGNSISLGLIGTIDGVTGGLVLTGVGSNGVVTYNLYLRGNFIVDGTITAAKMQVGALSAITANLGVVTAGVIESPNGKFLIDLNNQYEIISD